MTDALQGLLLSTLTLLLSEAGCAEVATLLGG